MVLTQEFVEQKLAEKIIAGSLKCYKCAFPLKGSDIIGFQLSPADGKPKVSYACPNERCNNHPTEEDPDKKGWRTLRALGIVDLTFVSESSPLSEAAPPEAMYDDFRAQIDFDDRDDDDYVRDDIDDLLVATQDSVDDSEDLDL